MNELKLTELSVKQFTSLLGKFQLEPNRDDDWDKCWSLIKCSKTFNKYFSMYDAENITVSIKQSKIIGLNSDDNKVKWSINEGRWPCSVCRSEVTNAKNKNGEGLQCTLCHDWFHNHCTAQPMTKALYEAISASPEITYLKIFCPTCVNLSNKVRDLNSAIECLSTTIDQNIKGQKTFASIVKSQKPAGSGFNDGKKIMTKILKEVVKQQEPERNKEMKIREERTRIIRQPKNKALKNSREIRKEINKHYPRTLIRNCRTTAGGSILIELDDKKDAEEFESKWDTSFCGGNAGLVKPGQTHSALIKYVDLNYTEDEIKKSITSQYTGTFVELFKKGPDRLFTGTVKITFQNKNQFELALVNKVNIGSQKFYLEKFISKPRVIKCNRCQQFGHISRLCRSAIPKCGKCSEKSHETKECSLTSEACYKCSHCEGNHLTGSMKCPTMIQKLEELTARYNYGS